MLGIVDYNIPLGTNVSERMHSELRQVLEDMSKADPSRKFSMAWLIRMFVAEGLERRRAEKRKRT